MKKILFVLFTICTLAAVAQSTSPRFGTTAGRDNTFRTLTCKLTALTDAAGADSATLSTSAYNTLVTIAVLDSFALKSPTVTKAFLGDQLTIIATGTSGDMLKFTGTNWVSAGTATLSSGLKAVVRFIFDGAKWVEASRVVQ